MVARGLNVAVGVAAILAAAGLAILASVRMGSITGAQGAAELLLKMDLESHEPYSPPANMYLWWGPTTNHRFAGSGEHIRHLLNMGQIEGGEWRDRMFLGNNGVATFRGQRFRRISETCCSTIVVPPMEWDFPVYNIHKVIGQRIRNFVANGNMLVLTGGILSVEFINSYFFENLGTRLTACAASCARPDAPAPAGEKACFSRAVELRARFIQQACGHKPGTLQTRRQAATDLE